jgi:hypothetical protein
MKRTKKLKAFRALKQKGHPIAFKNKELTRAQLKWPIHEKELFVVVNCFKC